MPSKQSQPQKEKEGELESHGREVKSRKQAIAIALHEAGASDGQRRSTACRAPKARSATAKPPPPRRKARRLRTG